MKLLSLIFTFLLFSPTIWAQTLNLKNASSSLDWTGKAAFNAYSLSGNLETSAGSLELIDDRITSAEITIDMKTLSSENQDLEKHLRSKDFFDVKKFKQATFKLLAPIDSEGVQKVKGELTIKDQTLPQSFDATIDSNNGQIKISGTMMIDRTSYGIKFNSPSYFDNLKDQAIADEFELEFELVF